jgi:hypothetical protein
VRVFDATRASLVLLRVEAARKVRERRLSLLVGMSGRRALT